MSNGFFFHYYPHLVWGWKWLLHFITWPPKSPPLFQMFLPAQLFVAAFPEIFSFSQLSVWMSWHCCATSVYSELRRPHCCCIYFQTPRASPLTLNHMRLCKKNKHFWPLACRMRSKSTAEHWDFNGPFHRPAHSFIPDFPLCPKQPLCSDEVPNIELTLKLMAKDPHPALVGPFTDFTALMFNFKRQWPLQQAHARIFHIFPPTCIILSCFNLLFSLQRRQKEPRDIRNREKNKQGWKKKIHADATFLWSCWNKATNLSHFDPVWILTIAWALCQPIIKLSFWTAPLRPLIHSREFDLCPAFIHDTLLTLHTHGST